MNGAKSAAANWRNGLAPNDLSGETLNSRFSSELEGKKTDNGHGVTAGVH